MNREPIPAGTSRAYLVQHVAMLRAANMPGPSLPGFVLQYGRQWKAAALPADYERGAMKECFRNAALLAMDCDNLIYVEGHACNLIPVHHAWCVDRAGNVFDPTWPDSERCDYFGVPFWKAFVRAEVQRNKAYGLIDRPENHFAIASGKVSVVRFLHQWEEATPAG